MSLGDRSLEVQSQLICDWSRAGRDRHQGFYFLGQINLEKTQGKVLEAVRIKDEDKEILGKDFVMGGRETALLPWRIIRDQIVPRPGHRDRKIENGDRATQTAEEFASSVHELAGAKVCGKFQNHSNARRTRLENINNYIMSSIKRDEVNEQFETNSEEILFNINVNRRIVIKQDNYQRRVQETQFNKEVEHDINRNIRDKFKLRSNLRRNAKSASDSRNNVTYKAGCDLPTNCAYSPLDQFITVDNITRLSAFLFIFFITCALHSISLEADRSRAPWPFPGADAKAVISLSKNVLMTDADHKQVSSLGKIDPPSESTKEDATFNDFPDVDSDRSVAGASSRHGPGGKGKAVDRSGPSGKRKSPDADSENEDNVDEYEAYDDSTGQESSDSNSKKQNIDNPGQYSDVEIADSIDEEDNDDDEEEEEDDEDEDWAGDMSSQPIFLPSRMNKDRGQAGVGTTGRHFTEQETPAKSTDDPLKREIPEYMLKLYQKFTQKHYIHPASDTVRSFSNINEDILFNISKGNELLGAKTRNHTLVFNISSFPGGELINLAQLRLYKLVERDRNTYIGDDRKVSLYEVIIQDDGTRHLKLVSQKHIYGRNSGWESFDVTPAVRRWVAEIESGAVQMLEVTIESIFNSVLGNDVDISTEPRSKKEPLLVVFSKQINKRLVHQQERDELLRHDMTLSDIEDVDNFTATDSPPSAQSSASTDGDQSDDDEEEEDEEEDSSKEDSYGSIDEMTSYAKVTQSMRTGKEYLGRSKQRVRVKRSKTSSKRNICRRTKLEVDFRDIEGHGWIVAPQRYQAFECSGKCYFPLGDHLRPTKHAIIRANLHVHNKKVTRPCCVPTKLDSISLLYLDSKTKGYTFKYNFEGMKVVECGCR